MARLVDGAALRSVRIALGWILTAMALVVALGPVPAEGATLDDLVRDLYQHILGRQPDTSDVTRLVQHLQQSDDRGILAVVFAILDSDEALAHPSTPGDLVNGLYRSLLGRDADPEGARHFVAALADVYLSMIPSFLGSPEFLARQRSLSPTVFVESLYVEALGRTPGSAELPAWVSLAASGAWGAVATGIFGSPEALAHPRTMAERVGTFYRALLGRDASESEILLWMPSLRASILQITAGFPASPEFRARFTLLRNATPAGGSRAAARPAVVSQPVVTSSGQLSTPPSSPSTPASPPALAITSPAANATVSGTLQVVMTATGMAGGNTFTLTVDGGATSTLALEGSSTATMSWDTTGLTNGAHTLTASVTDSAGRTASASVGITVANGVASRVLRVGPTRSLRTPSQAAAIAQDGDTIEIDAAVYRDVATWRAHNLVIRGVGGRPRMDATGMAIAQDKGVWLIQGNNNTIDNIEFTGAHASDNTGAGIRQEGSGVTIRNCYIHHNENGIMGGNGTPGDMIIEHSEIAYNGYGDGYTHNIYVRVGGRLIVRHNYFHHSNVGSDVGHLIKSRSREHHILYNRIADESDGSSSYQINFPWGGLAYVVGNVIQQAPNSGNRTFISFGEEGTPHPQNELYVVNNTMINDDPSGGRFVVAYGATTYRIINNLFVGVGTIGAGQGPGEQISNLVAPRTDFVNAAAHDYRPVAGSLAVDRGTNPGSANGVSLLPVSEYVHPLGQRSRTLRGSGIDIGAYEASQ